MAEILIVYDSASDRKFTAGSVKYVRESVERASGMEIRVKYVDDAETEDVFWADPALFARAGAAHCAFGRDGSIRLVYRGAFGWSVSES